jgi:glycosyltransferase involved in cell wall biosynthesis
MVLKFMLISTHINQSNGYSKVSYNIIRELAKYDWLNVIHYGIQNAKVKGRNYPENVSVYDAIDLEEKDTMGKVNEVGQGQGFGFKQLRGVLQKEKPDIVMIYNDFGIINAYLDEIKSSGMRGDLKVWIYADMVYEGLPMTVIDRVNREVDRVFTFTKGWKTVLKGMNITRPIDVITHGIDSSVFHKIDKVKAKKACGFPSDMFMISSFNRNQPRKRLDILIMAFVELIVKYPTKNIFMLCVCDKGDNGGHQLFDIFQQELKRCGASLEHFANRLLVPSRNGNYTDEEINTLYNAADIGVSCSEGEGFGLCVFEQMSVGVPQVVSAINGHIEYCNDENSILVKPRGRYYMPTIHSYVNGMAYLVDSSDIAKGMEQYLFQKDLYEMHSDMAEIQVTGYKWNSVIQPLVKRLQQELEEDDD